ncbi:MAG: hypothetical protein ACK4PI_02380 [Tepidisphaerales bacterium]
MVRQQLARVFTTSAGWDYALLRLAVAGDLFLDGIRAAGVHWAVGNTRLALLDTAFPRFVVQGLGWLEVFGAVLLLLGLLTRPIAVMSIGLPLLAGLGAYDRLFSLQAASKLDVLVHSWAVVLVAVALVVRGAGPLSLDHLLLGRRRVR